MDSDNPEEPIRGKKKSVKGYASKLFKESSVSAVSSIVSTASVSRKVFRALVFLLFTAGFLYQCIKFLYYVLQYPTVVNIEINTPVRFLSPAYTFCNTNGVKRSTFCSKYPDYCKTPDKAFCDSNPLYCKGNDTKIPVEGALDILGLEESLELSHNLSTLFIYQKNDISGPFPRVHEENFATSCYSHHERIDNHLNALYRKKSELSNFAEEFMLFDPEENEAFFPNSKQGIVFAIHSPYEPINPFQKGIFLKPGRLYSITIQMLEEELLPYPYKTNCLNYTEKWLKANKSGTRSQEACRHRCAQDIFEECLNCSSVHIMATRKKRLCKINDLDFSATHCPSPEEQFELCVKDCRDDCSRTKYTYDVQEMYLTQHMLRDVEDKSQVLFINSLHNYITIS
ncbi:uncharacterized protein CDAR_543351 [Caerostris darwini]|uniref:Uncharacterized protein n=1 Tax=Caerostris darwini TaxID=1538125 RepID=A0AAV4RY34_9ARAC|nr:uncharacterized protein CDAR_543351 [Caerostris darwini]